MINGVQIVDLKQIIDERGKVMHMLRKDAPHFREFGEVYFSVVNPDAIKAWTAWARSNTVVFSCRAQRSNASIAEPAMTVADFDSPLARLLLAVLMSSLIFSLRPESFMKSSPEVSGAGASSGQRDNAMRIAVTG